MFSIYFILYSLGLVFTSVCIFWSISMEALSFINIVLTLGWETLTPPKVGDMICIPSMTHFISWSIASLDVNGAKFPWDSSYKASEMVPDYPTFPLLPIIFDKGLIGLFPCFMVTTLVGEDSILPFTTPAPEDIYLSPADAVVIFFIKPVLVCVIIYLSDTKWSIMAIFAISLGIEVCFDLYPELVPSEARPSFLIFGLS